MSKLGHDRRLVLGGVSLTSTRQSRESIRVGTAIRDELEAVLIEEDFFATSPFRWISIVLYYGLRDDLTPRIDSVNQRHGDLPVAIEVDVARLDSGDAEALRLCLRRAVLIALVAVAAKFELPSGRLQWLLGSS